MYLKLCLFSLILINKYAKSEDDDYLHESRQQCTKSYDLLSCAKYRALSYLTQLGDYYATARNETRPVRLIKMQHVKEEGEFFPLARQMAADNEFTKFLKFAQRQTNYYLRTQGIAVDLPEGIQILDKESNQLVEEGRGRKQKKQQMLILPLIMLLKLFKIKLMVAIILAVVLFIKKAIMLMALFVPTILQHLKHCGKSTHIHHSAPHHFEEEHDDYGAYYGADAYGKDYQRVYNGYLKNRMH